MTMSQDPPTPPFRFDTAGQTRRLAGAIARLIDSTSSRTVIAGRMGWSEARLRDFLARPMDMGAVEAFQILEALDIDGETLNRLLERHEE